MAVHRKHVLVIDDNVSLLNAMSGVLEEANYTVSTAQNLAEVDRHIHRLGDPFDLILVDVQMPDLNGDEIALVLRTMRKSKAPIYLLSALDPAELQRRAADVGADGFISKMAGTKGLLRRVQQILGDLPDDAKSEARR
jgi:two-component system response regulator VanR